MNEDHAGMFMHQQTLVLALHTLHNVCACYIFSNLKKKNNCLPKAELKHNIFMKI